MSTKATYDGTTGEFILNGAKHWITNAPVADVCVVWARLDGVVRGLYRRSAVLMAGHRKFPESSRCGPRRPVLS